MFHLKKKDMGRFAIMVLALPLMMLFAAEAYADDVSNAPQPFEFPHARHAGKFKINCVQEYRYFDCR